MKRLLLPLCLITAACATQRNGTEQVDLIVDHGVVITMAGANIADGAVAVRAGEIVEVASSSEVNGRFSARERIDARGNAIMPGLVNTHTHAPMALFRGIADDRDLMEWLTKFIFPAEARNVDAEFVRWGTRLAAAEMIASGTTTYADMYYFEDVIAEETRAAGLRAVLGETMIDFPAPDNKSWEDAIAHIRRFVAKYQNDPLITPALAPHAPFTVSPAHLKEVRALATELHAPILIHVAETSDEVKQVKERYDARSPVAHLEALGFLGDDVVAAHGIWLDGEDIAILSRRGVGVAHCPESNMMLASGVAPVTELTAGKVDVGIGTDGPAGSNNNLDMFEEMASAARLQKISKKDPKALSARAVLEMATIGGARVLGLDKKIGSLERGKRADLIVVNLNTPKVQPLYSVESAIVYAASGDDVTHTIVDGKVLMRDRRVLTVDVAEVIRMATFYRDRVLRTLATQ